jgi:hypothetical protein
MDFDEIHDCAKEFEDVNGKIWAMAGRFGIPSRRANFQRYCLEEEKGIRGR